jgi:hypothetical protein
MLAAGGQGQNRNLASRLSQLDEQVGRQQELLYSVDFQLQEMERRVARAKGVRSDEETKQLNMRIQQLTGMLEGVNAEHLMLLEQVGTAGGRSRAAAQAAVVQSTTMPGMVAVLRQACVHQRCTQASMCVPERRCACVLQCVKAAAAGPQLVTCSTAAGPQLLTCPTAAGY